ncbi:MCE family protein [Mycolicibacterium arenosum]|uniref:MCE family protein n=1 Tax=Mycolicibacterium arenosum TaxID=2952157 RepID=A0ABT1M1C2_9MYCO|nr:MCE family protein [Mycolicibacterium sp. CAU 1645]
MIRARRAILALGAVATTCLSACSGINSLPLPGTLGRGADSQTFVVQVANIGTLESNSPVMIDDVVVGSVGAMRVDDWKAVVDVHVQADVVVPANVTATVGQTSLLGSMHLALDPPLGERPRGRLDSGATIPLGSTSTYPSTEQTLSSLSTIVNAGGLGQVGDIVHNLSEAFSGREVEARDLLTRLDRFIGVFARQRDNVIASLRALDRLSGTLSSQNQVLTTTLEKLPAALDVLERQRPNLTAALDRLGAFGDAATTTVNDTRADLVRNLRNLVPTLKSLADVGPEIDEALAYATVFPFGQSTIDRGLRGDYMNLFVTIDLTRNRTTKTLPLGTRWGNPNMPTVPAPGDPGYEWFYTVNPLAAPVANPPSPPVRAPLPTGIDIGIPPDSPARTFPFNQGWG